MSKNKYPCIFLEGKWGLLCFLSLRSFNRAFKIFFVGDFLKAFECQRNTVGAQNRELAKIDGL